MAQLWGGRFTKETDQLVYNFNASISFDQKFYKQDIEGSIAHVRMLGKQGILTQEEMQAIVSCLQEILADVESGKLAITSEYEDIHSLVEANLLTVWEIPERNCIPDEAEMIRWHWTCVCIPGSRFLRRMNCWNSCCRYCFAL